MRKRYAVLVAGTLALGLFVAAASTRAQSYWSSDSERLHRDLAREQARVSAEIAHAQARLSAGLARLAHYREGGLAELQERLAALQSRETTQLAVRRSALSRALAARANALRNQERIFTWSSDENGWLGVTVEEVSADRAKELKLANARGVYLSDVDANSPAGKAGLKVGDVITEFNGQRVEGTAQFRRLVQEIPPGRSVSLSYWRDGRSQNATVEMGSRGDQIERRVEVLRPHDFSFNIPMPELRGDIFTMSRQPRLGINGQDLNKQLGSYFGAPDGEGVLVTEVNSGTPAEKAGMKAGDVITKIDGNRVRDLNELRERLRDARDKKSVSVTVLRNHSETNLNVEIEQPNPPRARSTGRRTV